MKQAFTTYKGVVYPWHCDHMGHMNVMWYTGKMDEATWIFFADLGLGQSYIKTQNRGMAALEIKTSYKSEVLPGETLEIQTELTEISGKIIKFTHKMYARDSEKLAAVSEIIAIHMDTNLRKSCPFPKNILEKAQARLQAQTSA